MTSARAQFVGAISIPDIDFHAAASSQEHILVRVCCAVTRELIPGQISVVAGANVVACKRPGEVFLGAGDCDRSLPRGHVVQEPIQVQVCSGFEKFGEVMMLNFLEKVGNLILAPGFAGSC